MNLKRRRTMYIKNRRNSSKFNGFGSNQTLCLTESLVLRNRLLFIYSPLGLMLKNLIKIKKFNLFRI
jgi:hypothetical protein